MKIKAIQNRVLRRNFVVPGDGARLCPERPLFHRGPPRPACWIRVTSKIPAAASFASGRFQKFAPAARVPQPARPAGRTGDAYFRFPCSFSLPHYAHHKSLQLRIAFPQDPVQPCPGTGRRETKGPRTARIKKKKNNVLATIRRSCRSGLHPAERPLSQKQKKYTHGGGKSATVAGGSKRHNSSPRTWAS